jgi:hypothetical protein
LKEEDTCGLHWMATPQDAMLYWTRYLNFWFASSQRRMHLAMLYSEASTV